MLHHTVLYCEIYFTIVSVLWNNVKRCISDLSSSNEVFSKFSKRENDLNRLAIEAVAEIWKRRKLQFQNLTSIEIFYFPEPTQHMNIHCKGLYFALNLITWAVLNKKTTKTYIFFPNFFKVHYIIFFQSGVFFHLFLHILNLFKNSNFVPNLWKKFVCTFCRH